MKIDIMNLKIFKGCLMLNCIKRFFNKNINTSNNKSLPQNSKERTAADVLLDPPEFDFINNKNL
jgi:hypothetical protein